MPDPSLLQVDFPPGGAWIPELKALSIGPVGIPGVGHPRLSWALPPGPPEVLVEIWDTLTSWQWETSMTSWTL